MTSDEGPETADPLRLSPEQIDEFIKNTRRRISRALYELEQEASYGALNAEIVE